MWIDTRTGNIKVYEKPPTDPYVKRMTWVPEENAWVLFAPPELTIHDIAEFLGDPVQTQAIKDFEAGKLTYAEMRGLCG
jgi:hypothetical protein